MPSTPFYMSCLEQELANRCEKNSRYSMRAFARALDIAPGPLSQILSQKRVPSYKMARQMLRCIELTPEDQKRFLASIAEAHHQRGLTRMNPFFRALASSMSPETQSRLPIPPVDLSIDHFRIIGDWYHYAILFLTYVDGFDPSPKWIASQLGISESEAKLGVERLLSVGMLKRKGKKLVSFQQNFTTADKHLTTPALRKRQRQILEKAIYSLENDPIETRNFSAMTMAIDEAKIPAAKEKIEKFTQELSEFLESGRKNRVYELSVCLFPLQRRSH
jgi:uncharacterized protein (TIGR02147 family)